MTTTTVKRTEAQIIADLDAAREWMYALIQDVNGGHILRDRAQQRIDRLKIELANVNA